MSGQRSAGELDLSPFESALAEEFAHALDGDAPAPDVVAVLTRARELKPASVPEALLREARELAPIVSLRARARSRDQDNHALSLDPFVSDYRAELDAQLRSQRLPALTPSHSERRARYRKIGIGLGVAASLALLFSLWRAVEPAALHSETSWQAERVLSDSPANGHVDARHTATSRVATIHQQALTGAPASSEAQPVPEDAPLPPAPTLDEHTTTPDDDPALHSGTTTAGAPEGDEARASAAKRRSDLRRLDHSARALWSAGKLRAAERTFRKLIELGARHRLVELAVGDLFTLTRRLHGEHAQPRLWREYLARFPRGRFADDARAGLCTRARAGAQQRCWKRYLRYFPDGAHSKDARRRLGAREEGGQ
jgi:hypothetical protein